MNRTLSEVAQNKKATRELQATLDNVIARNRGAQPYGESKTRFLDEFADVDVAKSLKMLGFSLRLYRKAHTKHALPVSFRPNLSKATLVLDFQNV